jgi:hypothetical protein
VKKWGSFGSQSAGLGAFACGAAITAGISANIAALTPPGIVVASVLGVLAVAEMSVGWDLMRDGELDVTEDTIDFLLGREDREK